MIKCLVCGGLVMQVDHFCYCTECNFMWSLIIEGNEEALSG